MSEPLRGKIESGLYGDCHTFDVDDVKSACEFYKKYKDMPDEFWELNELPTKWNNYCKKRQEETEINLPLSISAFNNWLFNYTFGDVVND